MSIHSPDFTDYPNINFKTCKIGIIKSLWNSRITDLLFNSAYNYLISIGIDKKNIVIKEAPGSMELVYVSDYILSKMKLDGVIALGCVIKGETDHDIYISNAVSNGLLNVSLNNKKPVIFGVLTTNNFNQAIERAGGKHGDKGIESAQTLLKVLSECN